MYDARMRDWYIKSAASPKDVVILLDTSGSMTGLRKEIAKHVVINIMETLGEDDFLTVLTFSDETRPLVDCFRQAVAATKAQSHFCLILKPEPRLWL